MDLVQTLYEDEAILVVSKPNNVLVHPSYYARNIKSPSLLEVLEEKLEIKLYPVHRLDYKTSGVIVFAKTPPFAAELQKQFEANTVEKKYMALVRGYTKDEGSVDSPVKNPDTGKYKEALTHYKTRFSVEIDIAVQPYPKSRYSLLELRPKTGRMHQLRKHMNKIAHPIIGDHKYGNRHHNRMFEEKLNYPNMFLHAAEISFFHPLKECRETFVAEYPDFWNQALVQLKELNAVTSGNNQNHSD